MSSRVSGYVLQEEITIGDHGGVAQKGFKSHRLTFSGDSIDVAVGFTEGTSSYVPLGAKSSGRSRF